MGGWPMAEAFIRDPFATFAVARGYVRCHSCGRWCDNSFLHPGYCHQDCGTFHEPPVMYRDDVLTRLEWEYKQWMAEPRHEDPETWQPKPGKLGNE